MRRALSIVGTVAVAILVIVGGAFGVRTARDQIALDRAAAGAPQAAPSGDEAKYHELAERLLNFGYSPSGTPSVTLLPGALPSDPAVALPNISGARLIGSAVRTQGTDRSVDVVADAPGDPQQVVTAYEQGFKDQGWSAPPGDVGVSQGGGFQSSTPPVYKLLCKGDSAYLSLSVAARPGQPNDVRVHVQPSVSSQGASPCTASKSRPQTPANHLPTLRPPDGTTLLGAGGGLSSMGGPGNTSRQTSEATATTALSSGDLEAAFAKQMMAAGWTRTAGRDDGALAWSTWASSDAGWSAMLIVADTTAQDRRSLLLRAEGPG